MLGVGRDLCGSSSPTLLLKQGHLQQAAQDLVQGSLEYLQRRRLHHLPGQPVPVLRHPQREEVLHFWVLLSKNTVFILNPANRSYWGWWNTGTGCPERCFMPPPWKHSRPGWTGLWATWSSWRCPCSLQGGWTRWPLKVPSNPNYSMILWFYNSMVLRFYDSSTELLLPFLHLTVFLLITKG